MGQAQSASAQNTTGRRQKLAVNSQNAQLAKKLCKNLLQLSRNREDNAAQLSEDDRKIIDAVLAAFDVPTNATDFTKCEFILDRMDTIISDISRLQRVSPRATPWLRRLLFLGTALNAVQTCSAAITPPVFPKNPTCTLRVELINTWLPIFAQPPHETEVARYFVEGDLWPDIRNLADNPDVYNDAKRNLKMYDGQQDEPVMTMLMGSAGSGKNYQMEKYMNKNRSFKRGLQGAVIIDTDEIMESMPGYATLGTIGDLPALLNYGAIKHGALSVPVTHLYAADVYHDAAKVINDKLQQEVLDARKSFVMQGIGTKLYKVTDLINQAKALGYKVNVLAVTADADVRWERARKRAVQTGRYVPKPATLKGHSADKWRDYLHDLQTEGKVDFFEVLET